MSSRSGLRVLVIFEGRDAAGKDGTIKHIIEHLSPRETRVVALGPPSDRDRRAMVFSALRAALCPPAARSCCSIAAGTTAPASSA